MIKQWFGTANVDKTTGDKPAERGSSSRQVASALALMQKNTLEVEQMSIPANFSRSSQRSASLNL